MVELLDAWRTLPVQEQIVRLWLIGMEREQLVAVAYAEDRIADRLARMPIDDDVRAVILHALRWVWRDEEMHATYVRGVLKGRGPWRQALQTSIARVQGAVAGWVSAVQHHHTWREAPLARTVAELLEIAGSWAGHVPPEARKTLQWRSFRQYCAFNIDAERTAELSWRRMVELAAAPGVHVPPEDVAAFRRMADDEARHTALFRILYDAFDDQDGLLDGWDAQTLASAFAAIDPVLCATSSPGVGFGGIVRVVQGTQVSDRSPSFQVLLDQQLAPFADRLRPGATVAIKTVFMRGVDREDPSPIVTPALLHQLIDACIARGADVRVLEASNLYGRLLAARSVIEVADYFGITPTADRPFERIDVLNDQRPHAYRRGTAQQSISASWADADLRIVFGKLASHPVDQAIGALDALQGLGGPTEAFLYADRRADRSSSIMMVLDAAPPDLALVDAWTDVPDGVAGVLGCPWPATPLRFYAGADPLAVDRVLFRHLGVDLYRTHPVKIGIDWFGDPLQTVEIQGIDRPIEDFRGVHHTPGASLLGLFAFTAFERASRRGARFVPQTDERAFPFRRPKTPLERGMNEAIRRLLDLR